MNNQSQGSDGSVNTAAMRYERAIRMSEGSMLSMPLLKQQDILPRSGLEDCLYPWG